MDLRTALQWAAARLRDTSDSPELDAGLLLAHLLAQPRSYLFGHPDANLALGDEKRYAALVDRRRNGEPVAYLTGHKEFWSLDLRVNDSVLVPRPETETLVETALGLIPADACIAIADLGTGSGAIALALASERPGCRVIATDRSPAALAMARGNAARLGLPNLAFYQGDWFAPLAGQCFEMVVSNPPYVAPRDPHLAALAQEPRVALVAPGNGLRCLRLLIEQAPAHLSANGRLLLEHGAEQDGFVRRLLGEHGFTDIATIADLAGNPRVTGGRLLRRQIPNRPRQDNRNASPSG